MTKYNLEPRIIGKEQKGFHVHVPGSLAGQVGHVIPTECGWIIKHGDGSLHENNGETLTYKNANSAAKALVGYLEENNAL